MPKVNADFVARKKEEILKACLQLYQSHSFKEVSLGQIMQMTSLGRSSIYHYFANKEEVFLALLAGEYEKWAQDLLQIKVGNQVRDAADYSCVLAASVSARELLLKILTMNSFEIEEAAGEQALREFKLSYRHAVEALEQSLSGLSGLDRAGRQSFVQHFLPFMFGLYPYTHVSVRKQAAMQAVQLQWTEQSVYELCRQHTLVLLRGLGAA